MRSRNLSHAVFNGETGFIGIRLKFGSRFLDTEYHWDMGAPHGTLRPLEDLGLIPDDIEPVEGWWNSETVHVPENELAKYLPNEKLFKYLEEL